MLKWCCNLTVQGSRNDDMPVLLNGWVWQGYKLCEIDVPKRVCGTVVFTSQNNRTAPQLYLWTAIDNTLPEAQQNQDIVPKFYTYSSESFHTF